MISIHRKVVYFLVIISILLYPSFALAKLAPGDFVDIRGHWAESEIQSACNLGLMSGESTEQGFKVFRPEDTVSRAQVASVLERTFRLDYGNIRFIKAPAASDYYQDVDDNTWYSEAVVVCAINKIFNSSFCFNPAQAVNRLEVAQTIYNSFQAKNISVPMIMMMPYYEDTGTLSDEERNAVVFVSNTGIMKGDGQEFRPADPIKRAELARVLNRCAQMMALNQDSNGQEYSVPAGQTFLLSLNSNPSTGFQWNPGSWDEKVVSLSSRNFETGGNKALAGQGGLESFVFKARNPGSTEINLTYARPWESVQPQQTYSLKVKVISPTDNSKVQLSIKSLKSKNELLEVDLNIPQISGLKDEKVQAAINQQFIEDADALLADLEAQAREGKNDSDKNGYPFRPYGVWSGCEKYYENGKLLSLYIDYYNYTGGAHGLTERRAYNYNLETGGKMELQDFFKPGYDFKTIINKQIEEKIDAQPEYYFEGDMGFQGIGGQEFCVFNDCLVVYFSQYEIAPYAAGIPEFSIPLDIFQDNLKSELLM